MRITFHPAVGVEALRLLTTPPPPRASANPEASVVIPRLEELDPVVTDDVDDAVLLGEAPRPGALRQVLQRLRFSDACKRIPQDGLDDREGAQGHPAVCLHPIPEILAEFGLEDGEPLGP